MYVPLKIMTEYSLLKSTIKIDTLVSFLQKHNITSCAICDTNLYGVMEFYTKLTSNNIKPIIGLEVVVDGNPLYLYAKNNLGYQALLKINTNIEMKSISHEGIQKYLENIKIILPYTSYSLLDMYPDAYLGYTNNTEKIEANLKSNKTVFLRDARCLDKDDTRYLKVLEAIEKGVNLSEIATNYDFNYLTMDILEEDKLSTLEFINDLNVTITKSGNHIPVYNSEINSFLYLKKLAYKGLKKRLNGKITKEYQERLDYELNVIKKMGFVDYFLIVYDYVFYAKKNDILVGPGRGSAAGSLVSYCIGITDVDPLKYHLLFERFLNPERITMPDIDIDFEYTKRGQIIDYVRDKYGHMNVAPIMTFGTLSAKQVIRDVARVMDIDSVLVDQLSSILDAKLDLKENMKNSNVIKMIKGNSILKDVISTSLKLEGLKRHISTHAAGVVISSIPLDDVIPVCFNSDILMTGVTMEYLENLGLLKMDFLALRNLTIISNILDLVKNATGKKIELSKISLNDPLIFNLFQTGDTAGIFQYESSGMRSLMLKLKPTSFSDLVVAVALFRPGPMQNIDMFIRRKYGKEKISYLHPDLEPILKETYGVIVYQEQVMQILVKIGGYTYAEADNIRRAMSKKKESVMIEDKNHFITEAKRRGYSEDTATEIYNLILKFANYGFNKAHSVSYALIGYQMAYLKVHAPMYFIANLLNMSIGSEIKTKEYIDEARKKEINILKPDINISDATYKIKDNTLMLPLSSIKNLGSQASNSILEEREKNGLYSSYLDFVSRVYGKSVNKKTISSLIEAGVLDSLKLNKKTMIENLDIAINYAELISNLDKNFVIEPNIQEYLEYEEDILRKFEISSFGFYVNNHPVSKYQDKTIVKLENIKNYFNKKIKTVILVEKIKSLKTKKGDNMAFLTGSDDTGNIEFVIFPNCYNSLANIKKNDIIAINGKVTKRFDSYQVSVDFLNKI